MNAAQCNEDGYRSRVLTKILWMEAQRTSISDEDAERLLAPLKKRIMAGEFTKPPRRSYLFRLLVSFAAAMILSAPFLPPGSGALVPLADEAVPLSGGVPAGCRVSGRVVLDGFGAKGIGLALVNAESRDPAGSAVTAEDGAFKFAGLPPGTYRLRVTLPPGLCLTDEMDGGPWVALNGSVDLEVSAENENDWKDLEIRICHS